MEPEGPVRTCSQNPGIFHPQRVFNPSALLAPDGRSIIEALLEISEGILVEDGDLSRDVLLTHLHQHVREDIVVHDLSRALRLSTNHVYWITRSRERFPLRSEQIWPK